MKNIYFRIVIRHMEDAVYNYRTLLHEYGIVIHDLRESEIVRGSLYIMLLW